jgi:pyridinium-3,5-biscarboxylic acid mononucleotide sulfurtransferase
MEKTKENELEKTNNVLSGLSSILSSMESVLIAYSGGVDSTFLLKVSLDVLGDKVLAVTSDSPTITRKELSYARNMAKELGANHIVLKTDEMDCKDFIKNSSQRCFWCKSELFTKLNDLAKKHGYNYVVDGSNYSDTSDFRPGLKAARKLGVRSPLIEACVTKGDIRNLLKTWGLPIWNKPSTACLSSRVPYGQTISVSLLNRIEKAEDILHKSGFNHVRVRDHNNIARIEISVEDFSKLLDPNVKDHISRSLKELGYKYIAVDLDGYRTGSLNEAL